MTKKKEKVPEAPLNEELANETIVINGNCENGIKVENTTVFDGDTIQVLQTIAGAIKMNASAIQENAIALQKLIGRFENKQPFQISHCSVTGAEIGINIKSE